MGMFVPEPQSTAPLTLVWELEGLMQNTEHLLEAFSGKYVFTDEGKIFFQLLIRQMYLDTQALEKIFPDYALSLRNISWEIMRLSMVAGVWYDDTDILRLREFTYYVAQMLCVV